jgi:hypothetical protein
MKGGEGGEEALFQVSEQQKVATSSFLLLQSSPCHNLSPFSNSWYQEQHHNSSYSHSCQLALEMPLA